MAQANRARESKDHSEVMTALGGAVVGIATSQLAE